MVCINIKAFSNTVLKMFSVTFDVICTYLFFRFETDSCNSLKLFNENVQMKTLSKCYPNVPTFKFHGFCIAASQIEILR